MQPTSHIRRKMLSLKKLLPLALTPVLLSACESPAIVIDSFCRNYEPVCLSHSDSQATKDQVEANEAGFFAACPVEAAAKTCG